MKLYIIGDIDEENYREFSQKLTKLERNHKLFPEVFKNDIVSVELNSAGGNAIDALAFFSRMRTSPFKFDITLHGCAMSAAVLVLAAGDIRRMAKESWVMVHEDSDTVKNAFVKDIEKKGAQLRLLEEQWNELLASRTKANKDTWHHLHDDETYLNAEECLAIGLVEEII